MQNMISIIDGNSDNCGSTVQILAEANYTRLEVPLSVGGGDQGYSYVAASAAVMYWSVKII